MVSVKVLVAFLAFGAETLAAGTTASCSTQLGTKSVKPVSTKTSTKTTTVVATKKMITTKDKTVTPSPTTLTTTVTVTTVKTKVADPATKTATVISTENNYITQPVYVTDTTVTSTNTIYSTSTSTRTVPPPTSFTAVQDTPGYVAKRDTSRPAKRQSSSAKKYPQKVDCVRIVTKTTTKTTTSTVNGKTTTLQPATSIAISTVLITKTSTKFPADVSSTYTSTITNDVVVFDEIHETATETTSITVQTVVPGGTYYQACGNPRNIRSTANGGYKITQFSSRDQITSLTGSDPYNCCVACQTTTNCRASALKGDSCYLMIGDTCTPGQFALNQYKSSAMGVAYYVSNGPCGLFQNAGFLNPI